MRPDPLLAGSLPTPSPGSGPVVARLFDRLLAAVFLVAWLSLGAQIDVLAGARGLLPAAPWAASVRAAGASFLDAPSLFVRLGASDAALHAGVAAGVVLALLALAGVAPRVCFGVGTVLYLSYAIACRTFLGFQWDNLLIECGALATLLPRDRRARWAHVLFRVLLFKLYFESGLAKWGSPLHDWQDGSAMTFYYETAPLPARLAWYAHGLPAAWHHFESWFTLFFELVVPFAIFGPRRLRLGALAIFTGFQVVDLATANYGFFCYLALALHVFLLDDEDVERVRRWARRNGDRTGGGSDRPRAAASACARLSDLARRWDRPWVRRAAAGAVVGAYLVASLADAIGNFAAEPSLVAAVEPLRRVLAPFRVVNTYHLFGAITRERVEPELQTFDGVSWTAHDLRHKPGAVGRAPDLVAPHQPRVDFQLWFYGLSYRRGAPPYVAALLERACHEPGVIQGLFAEALPAAPAVVRMAFYRYRFTTGEERRATGAWWKRDLVEVSRQVGCGG